MSTIRMVTCVIVLLVATIGCQIPRCFDGNGCQPCERPDIAYDEPCCQTSTFSPLHDVEAIQVRHQETETVLAADAVVQPAPGQGDAEQLPLSRETWNLILGEAVEIALRSNTTLAVSSYTPRIVDTEIDTAISAFDPNFGLGFLGGKDDSQVASLIESEGAVTMALKQDAFRPSDETEEPHNVFLSQQLYTGGSYYLGLGTDYQYLLPQGSALFVNPNWRSVASLHFEQPLFRGRGPQVATSRIVIANLNQSQSVHEFRESINSTLRDVMTRYWEVATRQMQVDVLRKIAQAGFETYQREKGQMELGKSAMPDVTYAEARYLRYAVDLGRAEKILHSARIEMRRVLGQTQHENGTIFIDTSRIGEDVPVDWEQGVISAGNRPILLARGQAIRVRRINLAVSENSLLPNVDFEFDYGITGLAERLDDSLSVIGDNQYNFWQMGLVYRRAVGQRAENAGVRNAALSLRQQEAELINQEHNILSSVHATYQRITDCKKLVKLSRLRTEVAAVSVAQSRELYLNDRTSLLAQLEAQETYADAALFEIINLFSYREALTNWLYVTGLIADEFVVLEDDATVQ